MAAKYEKKDIERLIRRQLPFEPTSGQEELIEALSAFILQFRQEVGFVLRGYAGTGKTSVVSALVRALPELNITPVLLAPTGRAAKVLSGYAGRPAYTVHKKIYYAAADEEEEETPAETGGYRPAGIKDNKSVNTLFIVDEASMLGEEDSLLYDLFDYVRSGYRCRVLLSGDTAQLPPVGSPYSPALDLDFLAQHFPTVNFYSYTLTEVVRQAHTSLVLQNATFLREMLAKTEYAGVQLPLFRTAFSNGSAGGKKDLLPLGGEDLEEVLQKEYSRQSREDIVIITRSNKRANLFNNEVRNRIFGLESDLAAGDLLMAVRNNYYWLDEKSKAGFIANGDMLEVMKIRRREEMYGFHFADIEARMIDYPGEPDIEVKVCLEALHVDAASLPYSDIKKLYAEVMRDYMHIPSKSARKQAVREDPYYNALQIKYAYSLTCHKTQGGQWPCVIVDQGFFTEDMLDADFLRWLYTALTRTTQKAYLLNFADLFYF